MNTIATGFLLNLLNRGASAWNAWRGLRPTALIDFTHTDLSYRDLSGYNFTLADFSGSNLLHTKFVGADLSFAVVVGTVLNQSCVKGTILEGVNLSSAYVDGDPPAFLDGTALS